MAVFEYLQSSEKKNVKNVNGPTMWYNSGYDFFDEHMIGILNVLSSIP